MESIKEDFDKKINEIELFYELLENSDSGETDLNKILKATFFLMLYNLIESTIRESIINIYSKIDSNSIEFNKLKPLLRKKILSDCKKYIGIENLHNGTSNDLSKEILMASLSAEKLFSGNIDNDLIKKTAQEYGFSYRTDPNITKQGEKLLSIKNYRNDLAHGNLTFSEIGRLYDINQLKEYKDETIAYLEKIIENIDYYLKNQNYLHSLND